MFNFVELPEYGNCCHPWYLPYEQIKVALIAIGYDQEDIDNDLIEWFRITGFSSLNKERILSRENS